MIGAVTLTPDDVEIARTFGRLRSGINRGAGTKDAKIGPQDAVEADIDATGAEIATARCLGVEPDFTVRPRHGGADLTLEGMTIDVKHTRHKNGRLLAPQWKAKAPCDIYVLITGSLPNYVLRGFAFGFEFLVEENKRDLGYGPTFALDQARLRSIQDLAAPQEAPR